MAGIGAREGGTMSEPVEALLFDLGGVIVDIDFARVTRRWAEHAKCDPALIAKRYTPDEAYKRHERGAIGDADYFAALRGSLGIDLRDEQFLDGWNAIFGGIIPGVADWAAPICARYPSYVFSNTNPAHERFWTAEYADTLKPFRGVFVSSVIGLRKPDREAFDYVAREMGVPVSRILFFDDSLANVEGARAAGLQAVHVRGNDDVLKAPAALP
jgi:putative hydrolase of the HAD superfamily